MKYLLADYERDLKIIREYDLFKDPPIIDVVIIKLLDDCVIKNTVGKFFNRHNIIEFKSPKDTLSVQSFKKVIGYSFFYMSQNNIEVEDTAISLVSVRYPRKLIAYLEKRNNFNIVPSEDAGIYYIIPKSGDETLLPKIQLTITSKLVAKDVEWLEKLRDNLTVKNLEECFDLYDNADKNREQLEEVLDGLMAANHELLEKEEFMTTMEKKYRKSFAVFAERSGMAQDWEQRGMLIGEQRGVLIGEQRGEQQATQRVFEYLAKGYSVEDARKKFLVR